MNASPHVQHLNPNAIALCTLGRWIANRNWVPATGGNFSIRASENSMLITASGKDKGELSPQDLLPVTWQQEQMQCTNGTPSAEAALHAMLYQLDPQIKVVLHTHSVQATVFSRLIEQEQVFFTGYEMQKAINGCSSHQQVLPLAVFDNTQQIPELTAALKQRWQLKPLNYGFLVRGHGLYVWGHSMEQAKRHLEGWEFLIHCELERFNITGKP